MASLTNNKIKDTYQSLVKFNDNGNITTSAKRLTDGFGNNSPFFVSTTQIGIGVTPTLGYDLHVNSNAKIGGNLLVSGNLTVSGTLTYIDVEDLATEDPLIKLARNNDGNLLDIGFYGKYVESTVTKYKGLFNDADDNKWKLFIGTSNEPTTVVNTSGTGYTVGTLVANLEGNVTGTVSSLSNHTTTNLAEGTNLYYTNARADARVNLQTGANLDLSSKDTDDLSEGTTNLYYTNARFDTRFTSKDTDDLSEGTTNLYFTTARARASFTEGTGVTITNGEIAIGQDVSTTSNVTFGNITGSAISGTTGTFSGSITGTTATFSGQVTIPETPTADAHAASKKYVDDNLVPAQSLSNVLGVGNTSGSNHIIMADGYAVYYGDSNDLGIYHFSDNSYISNTTGQLYIDNNTDNGDIIFRSDDGSGGITPYITIDGGVERIFVHKLMRFADDVQLRLGDNNDIRLYHNSTDGENHIENHTGSLYITNYADDEDIIFRNDNASGDVIEYFRLDGSTNTIPFGRSPHIVDNLKLYFGNDTTNDASIKWDSTASQLFIDGVSKFLSNVYFTSNAYFGDDDKLYFGDLTTPDLKIYHNGTNSFIENETGNLYIFNKQDDGDVFIETDNSSGGTTTYLMADGGTGSLKLFHYGSKKFETTSTGVSVTGAGVFSGNVDVNGGQLNVTSSDGLGRIELGGASGGYIDLKAPASDDYDMRFIVSQGGNEITTASGDLKINTANTLALTIDSTQNATFAGTITASGGSSNNNDDANILTLNASEHARLLVDTSSTSGHRATLALESNGNELLLTTTGSASELTSVGNLTVTSSATTFTGSVTANSFIKSGGTSSQYLMADGSVSTSTGGVTGTGVNNRLAIWNGTTAIDSDSDFYVDGDTIFTTNLEASGSGTFAGNVDVNGSQITVGTNNSIFAENNIRFKSAGTAYIDHNTTSQSIKFRLSNSSALDSIPLELTPSYSVFSGNAFFGGNVTIGDNSASEIFLAFNSSSTDFALGANGSNFMIGTSSDLDTGNLITLSGANGRLGIGTTSPASLLHIQGSTYNRVQTYFSGSYISGFKFSDLNGGIWYDAGADDLYLNANHANSQVILQSGGSTTLTLDASNNATFVGNIQTTQITATNGLNYLKRNTDASLQLRSENTRSGLFITKPATDTVMGSALVLADESYRLGTASYYHMVMLQNGNTYFNQNVGIGTTSPANKLTVSASNTGTQITTNPVGKFINTGNSFSKLIVGSDNNNFDAVLSMDNNSTLANTKLRIYIGNGTNATTGHSNDHIVLQGDGNILLNGGLLGLGNAASTPNISYGMFHYSGVGLGIYSVASGASQGIGFWLNNGSAYEAARFLSNGNLGIGTVSPTTQLHLKRTSGDVRGIMVETTVATSYAEVQLKAAREFRIGTGGSSTSANAASAFYVYDATAGGTAGHRFEISSAGDVQGRRVRSNTAGDVALSLQPTDSTIHYGFRIDSSTNSFNLDRVDSAGQLLRVTAAGNVGINCTPSYKLQWSDGTRTGLLDTNIGAVVIGSVSNDALAFYTNLTEKMRIDSSGNVGIAVTPNSWNTLKPLQIKNAALSGFSNSMYLTQNAYYDGAWKYIANSYASKIQADNGMTISVAATGTAGNAISFIDAISITNTGKVGIGTTMGINKLDVAGNINVQGGNGSYLTFNNGDANIVINNNGSGRDLSFKTYDGSSNSERMRIDKDGQVGIGTTSPSYKLHVSGSAQVDGTLYSDRVAAGIPMPSHIVDAYSSTSGVFAGRFVYAGTSGSDCAMLLRLAGGSTAPSYVDFIYGSVQTGYITTNGSATFYGSASDYRLKENVVELNGALDRLDNLQPKRFNFTSTPEQTVDGFLAHEVAEVVPEAIHGEKDAVNEDGEIIAQGIDQAKLVPLLVAAVQELRAEVKYLKDEINKLK